MPSASLLIAGLVAAIALLVVGLVVIFRPGDNTLIVTAIFGFALAIGTGALGYKQSTENATAIAANTVTTNTTHAIVNSRMDEFKQALVDFAAQKIELAAQRSEIDSLIAEARGMAAGRAQVSAEIAQTPEHLGDGTLVVTAPVSISVKAPSEVAP